MIVDAWGSNTDGQAGGAWWTGNNFSTAELAAGHFHSVRLDANGAVQCRGANAWGQCATQQFSDFVTIAAGCEHTLGIRSNGMVIAWGRNSDGQCNVPASVVQAIDIAGGDSYSMALLKGGTVICWGQSLFGQCSPPASLTDADLIESGGAHGMARRSDGSLVCWGWNNNGQCDVPADLGTVLDFAGGATHSVALRTDGTVRCWGNNLQGQCNTPSGLAGVTAVSANGAHNLALLSNGKVTAWGWNNAGQCSVPSGISGVSDVAAGGLFSAVMRPAAAYFPGSDYWYPSVAAAAQQASSGTLIWTSPSGMDNDDIDYRSKGLDLRCIGPVLREPGTLTIFANGARLAAQGAIAFGGMTNFPTNAAVVLESTGGISFGGSTTVSLGGSILAQSEGHPVLVDGSLTLANNAVLNPLSAIQITGTLDVLGGVVVAPAVATTAGSNLVSVNGTIDVDTLAIGGEATCLNSAVVAPVSVTAGAQLAASGQIVGSLANSGRSITTGDLVVVGNVTNAAGGNILAQVGVLYITGNLVNNGIVVGNVITAPGYQGGGTGGTQAGDGIRVAGSVIVGANGQLRFVEDLWQFSVCGDVALECPSDDVRFNGAKLSLDGCGGIAQSLEATSRDLGCVAEAFSGEETQVSLIGELDVGSGAMVSLVDQFDNAVGKGGEVVYARGLTVQAGGVLLTNGIKIVTRNALIQGTVDDMANICVVPALPDPDINGDGHINGIDLAFILAYWGSGTPIADLNDDGVVNGADLSIVLSGWTG